MAKSGNTRVASFPPVLVPGQIDRCILVVRGHKVLLDEQLAAFYGVATRVLVQAVNRNPARFPDDFMFPLSPGEWKVLRSQSVTSSHSGHGCRRYAPYAFTEQGVAMLSSVQSPDPPRKRIGFHSE